MKKDDESAPLGHPLDEVVQQIKQGVHSGRYVPGQRLIETDLAEELGVKRATVREALRVLAGDGVVELLPRRGARLRKLLRSDMAEMLPVLTGLFAMAIRLAWPTLQQPEAKRALSEVMDKLRHLAQSSAGTGFQQVGMTYHELIFQWADNRYLNQLYDRLHADLYLRHFGMVMKGRPLSVHMNRFERLHQAILDGDRALALMVVEEHDGEVVELLREEEGRPAGPFAQGDFADDRGAG